MSAAVHCDRCGEEMLGPEAEGSAQVNVSVRRAGGGGKFRSYDLCPDCLAALERVLNEGGTLRRVNRKKPSQGHSAAPQGHSEREE